MLWLLSLLLHNFSLWTWRRLTNSHICFISLVIFLFLNLCVDMTVRLNKKAEWPLGKAWGFPSSSSCLLSQEALSLEMSSHKHSAAATMMHHHATDLFLFSYFFLCMITLHAKPTPCVQKNVHPWPSHLLYFGSSPNHYWKMETDNCVECLCVL